MVDRVILGQRSGQYGLWVSKPGVDVNSASADQLLLSTAEGSMQAIKSGVLSIAAGGSTTVSIPNLGYTPSVLLTASPRLTFQDPGNGSQIAMYHGARYRLISSTVIEISTWSDFGSPTITVTYVIFARPYNG